MNKINKMAQSVYKYGEVVTILFEIIFVKCCHFLFVH